MHTYLYMFNAFKKFPPSCPCAHLQCTVLPEIFAGANLREYSISQRKHSRIVHYVYQLIHPCARSLQRGNNAAKFAKVSPVKAYGHMVHSCTHAYAGGPSIREYRILGNRQHVLTRDSNGHVQLWDILHVRQQRIILCILVTGMAHASNESH